MHSKDEEGVCTGFINMLPGNIILVKIHAMLHFLPITLHMFKPDTTRIIRNLLKKQFVNIEHIQMRRNLDQLFVSPAHSTKWNTYYIMCIRAQSTNI